MPVNPQPGQAAVWFPQWSAALRQLGLPPLRRQQYRLALIRYLQYCKQTHQPATVESARPFMEAIQAKRSLGASLLATWKEGLDALVFLLREALECDPGEFGLLAHIYTHVLNRPGLGVRSPLDG